MFNLHGFLRTSARPDDPGTQRGSVKVKTAATPLTGGHLLSPQTCCANRAGPHLSAILHSSAFRPSAGPDLPRATPTAPCEAFPSRRRRAWENPGPSPTSQLCLPSGGSTGSAPPRPLPGLLSQVCPPSLSSAGGWIRINRSIPEQRAQTSAGQTSCSRDRLEGPVPQDPLTTQQGWTRASEVQGAAGTVLLPSFSPDVSFLEEAAPWGPA